MGGRRTARGPASPRARLRKNAPTLRPAWVAFSVMAVRSVSLQRTGIIRVRASLTRMRLGIVFARFFAGAPDVTVIGREPPARGDPGRVNALIPGGCNGADGPLPSVMWTFWP